MPPNQYLVGNDLADYGVPTATTAQIIAASKTIDAYLKRPEGLIWISDSTGNPAYMAGLDPLVTYQAASAISPGVNVSFAVTGGPVTLDLVGEVLVLDRTNSAAAESCVVNAISGTTITLTSVLNPHPSGFSLDRGLLIKEEKSLPDTRSITRVARSPVVRVLSGMGRYAYGRRSQQTEGYVEEFNLLAAVSHFGGPPLWIPFDATVTGVNSTTGEIWVPAGVLLAYYSDVRLWYVAGWAQTNIPSDIKQACANLIAAANASGNVPGAFRTMRAGQSELVRFGNTIVDADILRLLAPFRIREFV